MIHAPVRLLLLACAAALLVLFGCAGKSPPSNFYLLSSAVDYDAASLVQTTDNAISIGVGPIRLPKYLDRPQIVTRVSENQVRLTEFDRWAEPLESNLSRVLAENLGMKLSTDRVFEFPWGTESRVDVQVKLVVLRLDSESPGNLVLTTHWSLLGADGRKMLFAKTSQYQVPTQTGSYNEVVAAASLAVERLSEEIADRIRLLIPEKTGS